MTIVQLADNKVAGLRILVVEDDYFVASEICAALTRSRAEVVGPAPDVRRALDLVRHEHIDCAVLDINLHGEMVFELASELQQRRIPAIFASGYDRSVIPPGLAGLVHLEKPIDLAALLRAIGATCANTHNETVTDS